MKMPLPKIGIVGLGRMGANMGRRLQECGYSIVAAYDANARIRSEISAEFGCVEASQLREVTAVSDVILTVVTDDLAMREIFSEEDADSLLKGAGGKLFINCATVSPAIHIEIEEAANRAGATTLEACMASSIPQARDGTLYLMVGGNIEVLNQARPILEQLGKQVRYVGKSGEAAKVKALVNMVMNINTAGLAEGLGLADALGLDLAMVRSVFAETGAASRVLITDGEDMQNRDHACFFSAAHAAKDSGIALTLAHQQGLHLPLAEATKEQYDRMVNEGLGELDKSGIAELTFRGRGAN